MYPQYKIHKLICNIFPDLLNTLGLKRENLHVAVCHSKSKEIIELIGNNHGHTKGICYPDKKMKNHAIFIFYDKHFSAKDALGTFVHELLHIRIYDLTRLFKPAQERKSAIREEKFIRDLEKFFLKIMKRTYLC